MTGYTGFSGDPELQSGHYLALTWRSTDLTNLTSLKIGLSPSRSGSAPVECINDPDKNIVLYISNTSQKVKMTYADNSGNKETVYYSLKGLTLASE